MSKPRVAFALLGGIAGGKLNLKVAPEQLAARLPEGTDLKHVIVRQVQIEDMFNTSPYVLSVRFGGAMEVANNVTHGDKRIWRLAGPFSSSRIPYLTDNERLDEKTADPPFSIDEGMAIFKNTMTKVHNRDELAIWWNAPYLSYIRHISPPEREGVCVFSTKIVAKWISDYLRRVRVLDLSDGIDLVVECATNDSVKVKDGWSFGLTVTFVIDGIPLAAPAVPESVARAVSSSSSEEDKKDSTAVAVIPTLPVADPADDTDDSII